MSDARLSRSSTSSTRATQALVIATSVDKSLSPQPLLTQSLEDSGSYSSSTGSVATIIYNLPLPPSSSEQDNQDSTMFSTIIDHTRGLLPRRESKGQDVAGFGDFDHTPPPSERSSVDIARKEGKVEGTTSQHLLHKPSQVGSTIATKSQSAPAVSKPPLSTSMETPNPLPGLLYRKTSLSQNGTVDVIRTELRDETQTQPSPYQTPLDLSNINSDED
jgi:hypothetical protein